MVQSIYVGEGRPKELLDSFQPSLSRSVGTLHQYQSKHTALKPFTIQTGPRASLQT